MLKVLIVGRTLSNILATASYHMYRAINDSLETECWFYGDGFNEEDGLNHVIPKNGRDDILELIDICKPDIIWVQWAWSSKGPDGGWRNITKTKIPKITMAGDPWSNLNAKANFAKTNCNAVILDSGLPDCPVWGNHWKDFPATLLHAGINTKVFYDMKMERPWDVGRFGAINRTYYPVRAFMHNILLRNKRTVSSLMPERGHPPVDSVHGYARALNSCKMVICTGEMYQVTGTRIDLFTHKYIETMACKSLCIGPFPVDAPELHFEDGVNTVKVELTGFMGKIRYYLDHKEERLAIAKAGYDTIQKWHTIERRASKFVELCNLIINNEKLPPVMS